MHLLKRRQNITKYNEVHIFRRVIEFLGDKVGLTKKLRAPAISRLQKVHNVEVFLGALKEHGVDLAKESKIANHIHVHVPVVNPSVGLSMRPSSEKEMDMFIFVSPAKHSGT